MTIRQATGLRTWQVRLARTRRMAEPRRKFKPPACFPRGTRWLLLATCWLQLWLASAIDAGSGSVVVLPNGMKKVTTGLSIEIDTEWLDGNGYRPVTIRVRPLGGGPAPADRLIRVKIQPRSWNYSVDMPSVTTWVELSQGNTVGERTLPVPQLNNWGSLKIETYEDGEKCDDLSGSLGVVYPGQYQWTEAAPSLLIIDADGRPGSRGYRFPPKATKDKQPERLPDVRSLASLFVLQQYGTVLDVEDYSTENDIDDNGIFKLVDQLGRIEILPPAKLPERWLDYTAVDLILISWPELQSLAASSDSWEAIRDWLATGPTLCVYGIGDQFQRLGALEELLELGTSRDEADPLERGWQAPVARDYADEIFALRNVDWSNNWYQQPLAPRRRQTNNAQTPQTPPDNPQPFLIHQVEQGRVVAIAAENPFPGTRADWCWIFNSISQDDWMWYKRHGLSFHRDNDHYWNLLIPGVGDAPVNSFLVLISLFVIAIGPINYFLLQQRRRLYLLLVTVPLGAGLVTGALFVYAVVDDGLGSRVRTRSLTEIDQASGRSVTWSRQSYYAGLAPSAGMEFPQEAAIYPIDHHCTGRFGQPKDRGRHRIWDEQQVLAGGYLNSRSTGQVLVIEPRRSAARLEFAGLENAAAQPEVTNRLGVDIEILLVIDDTGRALSARLVQADRSARLREVEEQAFQDRWGAIFSSHRPRYPEGFDPDQIDNASAIFGGGNYWWGDIDRGLAEPNTITSELERDLRGLANIDFDDLPRRSYVAIVTTSPEMSLGIAGVLEEASFHVVTGKW